MKVSFWFFIIIAILLVTFSVQNSQATEISFLIWTRQVPTAVIIIATFLLGLISGSLYGYFSRKTKTTKGIVTQEQQEDGSLSDNTKTPERSEE